MGSFPHSLPVAPASCSCQKQQNEGSTGPLFCGKAPGCVRLKCHWQTARRDSRFGPTLSRRLILWRDEVRRNLEAMGNHCLLKFTPESSFQGFLGGAKWTSSISAWRGSKAYSPTSASNCLTWSRKPGENIFIYLLIYLFVYFLLIYFKKMAIIPPEPSERSEASGTWPRPSLCFGAPTSRPPASAVGCSKTSQMRTERPALRVRLIATLKK